jgi:hypothetical protein
MGRAHASLPSFHDRVGKKEALKPTTPEFLMMTKGIT